ncbi:hypothetical protein BJP25_30640 [Actinokineospora bangkokensis]|uniref:Uncharacterized protein n=1 Tax=Actinokineospora bangkokensis TaxID=1193682 RepID=A0A1Q9LGM6_9PSEU|nr:hypothetical protein BJP25_30640 [Actinokineospora bangkokensis]
MSEYVSPLTAPPGGLMTEDAGAITGDLDLRSTCTADGVVQVKVRYTGAEDWYRVRGGQCKLSDPADHGAVHALLVGVLNRPAG